MRSAIVVAVALALRLWGLGAESFWIDEVFQRDIAAQPLTRIIADYRPHPGEGRLRDQAPLSHLLFHFFVGTGPVSDEATARLPSALAGAVHAGVFDALARLLVAPATAALATALLVLSPLDLWYSQELRFYEPWMLVATASTYAAVRALRDGGVRWWGAWTVLTVAGLYTCLMHGLVVAAQGVTALRWSACARRAPADPQAAPCGDGAIGRRSTRVRHAVAALLVVALATLPITWLVVREHARPAGTARPPTLSALPYTLFAFAAGYALGPTVESLHALPRPLDVLRAHPSVGVVGVVFGLAAAAGCLRLRRRPAAAAVVLPLLVVPPLGVLALSFATRIVYNVRYALPASTAFLLVVAAGCLAPRRTSVRVAAVAAVLAVTLAADRSFYGDPRYDKADARGAMAFVRADAEPAHVVVVGQLVRVVDYYTRGSAVTWQAGCDLPPAAPARAVVWVASGRDWERATPQCLDRLAATHRVTEYRRFVGIELWRLTRR